MDSGCITTGNTAFEAELPGNDPLQCMAEQEMIGMHIFSIKPEIFKDLCYSYLRASIGFRLDAFHAGYRPLITAVIRPNVIP